MKETENSITCVQCNDTLIRKKGMTDNDWWTATMEFDREHEYFHERGG